MLVYHYGRYGKIYRIDDEDAVQLLDTLWLRDQTCWEEMYKTSSGRYISVFRATWSASCTACELTEEKALRRLEDYRHWCTPEGEALLDAVNKVSS